MKKNILFSLLIVINCLTLHAQEDPYLWLEEVEGARWMAFVDELSTSTFNRPSNFKEYKTIFEESLEIHNSTDKIAYLEIYGEHVYNFWKDKDHIRGIWRRATKDSYNSGSPLWKTLLDLDEMSEWDNEKWVYKGVSAHHPSYNLFLVYLSKGGADATNT